MRSRCSASMASRSARDRVTVEQSLHGTNGEPRAGCSFGTSGASFQLGGQDLAGSTARACERERQEPRKREELSCGRHVVTEGGSEREPFADKGIGEHELAAHDGDHGADEALVGPHGVGLVVVDRVLVRLVRNLAGPEAGVGEIGLDEGSPQRVADRSHARLEHRDRFLEPTGAGSEVVASATDDSGPFGIGPGRGHRVAQREVGFVDPALSGQCGPEREVRLEPAAGSATQRLGKDGVDESEGPAGRSDSTLGRQWGIVVEAEARGAQVEVRVGVGDRVDGGQRSLDALAALERPGAGPKGLLEERVSESDGRPPRLFVDGDQLGSFEVGQQIDADDVDGGSEREGLRVGEDLEGSTLGIPESGEAG